MAFIPGYDYDIFISFAQADNTSFPGQSDGLIEQFYKNLNLMLARRIGCMDIAKILWENKKPGGNELFNPPPESAIQKSAIMICLYSAGYAASATCKQEFEIFFQKARSEKTGLKVGNLSRIIHVFLENIPADKWPVELNGTSWFHLYKSKESTDPGDTVDPNSAEFKSQMQKLGDTVWKLMNDFQIEQTGDLVQQPELPAENKKAFTIYLGDVADTLRMSRKRIITELKTKGYNVLTGGPPPDESAAHEVATIKALNTADIVIHLLDEFPGREITGDPENWYPQKQTELAFKSGKPQMIWVPEETDFTNIEEEKYKFFLQSLEQGKTSEKGYEFVRGPKCNLTQEIVNFAEHIKGLQTQKKTGNGTVSVMLDTHFIDQLYAIDLGRKLLENQIQPYINPQEDDPKKNINLMHERLKQVNKLIFIYGNVSEEWLRERMSAALELIITNNYPIKDFFIYMAPPLKETKNIFINQRFLKINVFNNSKNVIIDNDDLQILLNALKTSEE